MKAFRSGIVGRMFCALLSGQPAHPRHAREKNTLAKKMGRGWEENGRERRERVSLPNSEVYGMLRGCILV